MSEDRTPREPTVVEAVPVEAVPVEAVPVEADADPTRSGEEAAQPPAEMITEPAKLLRIASMVRELLDETRQASLDEAGRARLAEIYHRAVGELTEVLSPDLQAELVDLAPPLEGVPSESEIRVAQAQLVGWLEGLFHGIQAAMFAQQAAARQQFEELRRRGLLSQNPGSPDGPPEGAPRGGTYL
jgi:hypothetical protein